MYNFKYNTAIASIMELVNVMEKQDSVDSESLGVLCRLVAPFAPHLAEEVWVEILGQPFSVHKAKWPEYDDSLIVSDMVNIIIQINGKVRSQLTLNTQLATDEQGVRKLALEDEKTVKWLGGKDIKKVVFVAGRLINFVV